mgnify:CR=1 FL=1
MRRLQTRAGRREAGAFVVEGPQSIREALQFDADIRTLFVTQPATARHADLVALAHQRGIEVIEATDEVVEAMAETDAPQGMVAACALPTAGLGDAIRPQASVVILENLADPGNVGTIIRTADAVGASGVVLTHGSVDPWNGKCVRSTAGSIFHLPVVPEAPLGAAITAARTAGLTVAAATGDGEADLYDWLATAPAGICWIFGSEAHGVSDEAKAQADVRIRIPMVGAAESLNVATATAVCLYAAAFGAHGRMAGL